MYRRFGNMLTDEFEGYKIALVHTGIAIEDSLEDGSLDKYIRPKYEFIVINKETGEAVSFPYYWSGTIKSYHVRSAILRGENIFLSHEQILEFGKTFEERKPKQEDVLDAFLTIVGDAMLGTDYTFREFIHEFGYSDSVKSLKAYAACQETADKLMKIGIFDFNEFADKLDEKVNGE